MGSKSTRNYQRKVKKYFNSSLLIASHQPFTLSEDTNFGGVISANVCSVEANSRRATTCRNTRISPEASFNISNAEDVSVSTNSSPNFTDQLRDWAVDNRITQSAVTDLLKLLNQQGGNFSKLPLDARTLLRTPKKTIIRPIGGGQYAHIGLEKGLKAVIGLYGIPKGSYVSLQFNVDGIPLTKSTGLQLWPILCFVENLPESRPFAVAIFCGAKKPSSQIEYLNEFVSECLKLCTEGIN